MSIHIYLYLCYRQLARLSKLLYFIMLVRLVWWVSLPHFVWWRPVVYTKAIWSESICVWFGKTPILPSQPYRGVYLCRMMSVSAGARDKRPWVAKTLYGTCWDSFAFGWADTACLALFGEHVHSISFIIILYSPLQALYYDCLAEIRPVSIWNNRFAFTRHGVGVGRPFST